MNPGVERFKTYPASNRDAFPRAIMLSIAEEEMHRRKTVVTSLRLPAAFDSVEPPPLLDEAAQKILQTLGKYLFNETGFKTHINAQTMRIALGRAEISMTPRDALEILSPLLDHHKVSVLSAHSGWRLGRRRGYEKFNPEDVYGIQFNPKPTTSSPRDTAPRKPVDKKTPPKPSSSPAFEKQTRIPALSPEVSEEKRTLYYQLLQKYKPLLGETEFFIFETMVIDLVYGRMTERNQLRARLNNRRIPSSYEATRGYMKIISAILEREANCGIEEQRDRESGNNGYFFVKLPEKKERSLPSAQTQPVGSVSNQPPTDVWHQDTSSPQSPTNHPEIQASPPHTFSPLEVQILGGMLLTDPRFEEIRQESATTLADVFDKIPKTRLPQGTDVASARKSVGEKLLAALSTPEFNAWYDTLNPETKDLINIVRGIPYDQLKRSVEDLPARSTTHAHHNAALAQRLNRSYPQTSISTVAFKREEDL